MRVPSLLMLRAAGPAGAFSCGLALLLLGLFLLTPLAVLLIQGVGWALIVGGVLLTALATWAWLRQRRP